MFSGSTTRRKVSMRGASSKETSADGILANARAARMAREERTKREQASKVIAYSFQSWKDAKASRIISAGELKILADRWKENGPPQTFEALMPRFLFVFTGRLTALQRERITELERTTFDSDSADVLKRWLEIIVLASEKGALKTGLVSVKFATSVVQMCLVLSPDQFPSLDDAELEDLQRLQLETATALCSPSLWQNSADTLQVVLGAASEGLIEQGRSKILSFSQLGGDLQSDFASRVLSIVTTPLLVEQSVVDSAVEAINPGYVDYVLDFTRRVLTIPNLAGICTDRIKETISNILENGRFYRSLALSIEGRGLRGMDKPEAQAILILNNLMAFSGTFMMNLASQNTENISAVCIVLKEVLYSAANLNDRVFEDDSSDDELEAEIGKQRAIPSADVKQFLKIMGSIVANENCLTAMIMSDGLEAACAFVLRVMETDKSLENTILNTLAFSSNVNIFQRIWMGCSVNGGEFPSSERDVLVVKNKSYVIEGRAATFIMFTRLYAHLLRRQEAKEFFYYRHPFNKSQVRAIASTLKDVLTRSIWPSEENQAPVTLFGAHPSGKKFTAKLLNVLYGRDISAPGELRFADEQFWSATSPFRNIEDGRIEQALRDDNKNSEQASALKEILHLCPFLVPFPTRVHIFHIRSREGNEGNWHLDRISATIRRDFLVEDSYAQLNPRRRDLRKHLVVQFVDSNGLTEAGVDGGGLLKEFLHELIQRIFSPEYGLMLQTWEGKVYPNPASLITAGETHLDQFRFMGRMLGKVLQTGMLVNLPLADFFVAKMLGKYNSLDDLRTFDPELYRNLMQLKAMNPLDVPSLGLTFTISHDEYTGKDVDLVPDGSTVYVTAENRLDYIYRVAHYRLNTQIKSQTGAVMEGLEDVVDIKMIQMFSSSELQLLLQGTKGKLDTADLEMHTVYHGFTKNSKVVKWFWEIIAEFDAENQSKLLQFITSSPRAPLLGFKYLRPNFGIHRAEGDDRLPTSSTCVNILKLPSYKSKGILREKLLYSINSKAGFDLS